jgi:hypothetical protein
MKSCESQLSRSGEEHEEKALLAVKFVTAKVGRLHQKAIGVVKLKDDVIGIPAGTHEMMKRLAVEFCTLLLSIVCMNLTLLSSMHNWKSSRCRLSNVELCLSRMFPNSTAGGMSFLQPGSEVSRPSSLHLNIYPCLLELSLSACNHLKSRVSRCSVKSWEPKCPKSSKCLRSNHLSLWRSLSCE